MRVHFNSPRDSHSSDMLDTLQDTATYESTDSHRAAKSEWREIKNVPTLSEYFELDVHKLGTKFTNSGIYEAIKNCNLRQLQRCIEYGEDVQLTEKEFGSSYLMFVVNCTQLHTEKLYLPMLHELALAGCDPNVKDAVGNSPLGEAIRKNLEDMMVSLLQLGAEGSAEHVELIQLDSGPFQKQMLKWYQKHTPSLYQAVKNEDIRTVKRLLSHWCRVNIKYEGVSPHKLACKLFGKHHIICDLLETHFHTLEMIHSAIAGNKSRVIELQTHYRCDHGWLNKGYQENVLQPPLPRSIHDTVLALGHNHLLDIIPQPSQRPPISRETHDGTQSRMCLLS